MVARQPDLGLCASSSTDLIAPGSRWSRRIQYARGPARLRGSLRRGVRAPTWRRRRPAGRSRSRRASGAAGRGPRSGSGGVHRGCAEWREAVTTFPRTQGWPGTPRYVAASLIGRPRLRRTGPRRGSTFVRHRGPRSVVRLPTRAHPDRTPTRVPEALASVLQVHRFAGIRWALVADRLSPRLGHPHTNLERPPPHEQHPVGSP